MIAYLRIHCIKVDVRFNGFALRYATFYDRLISVCKLKIVIAQSKKKNIIVFHFFMSSYLEYFKTVIKQV